jgi:hypothetical protein
VERFFGEITAKVIRPGSFRSVGALLADIFPFLDHHNLNPTPYRWTADPKRILEKLDRAWGGAPRGDIQSDLWDITLVPPRTAHRENYSSVQDPTPFQSLEVSEKSHRDECRLRDLAGSTYLWIVTCRYGEY